KAFSAGIEKLSQSKAHFTERELAIEVLDSLQMLGVDGSQICKRTLKDASLHPLLQRSQEIEADRSLSTSAQVALETRLFEKVKDLSEQKGARVRNPLSIELASFRHGLSP